MLGLTGKCRRACDDCVDCAQDDLVCLRRNMRSLRGMRRKGRPAAPAAAATRSAGGA
jgi:prolyl 4-hydroxylase